MYHIELLLGLVFIYSIARFSVILTKDVLNPIIIAAGFFVPLYFGKYIFLHEEQYLVFSYNQRPAFSEKYLLAAFLLNIFAFLLFSFGFFWRVVSGAQKSGVLTSGKFEKEFSAQLLIGPFFVSFFAVFFIFQGVSSFDEILGGLNNRFELFSGRGYLMPFLATYKIAFLFYVMAIARQKKWAFLALLWLPSAFFDLMSGSRGKLILENLLPLLVVFSVKGWIKITVKHLIIGGFIGLLLATFLRVAIRETTYEFNKDKSVVELLSENMGADMSEFFDGPEAPYLDAMVILLESDKDLYFGETLISPVFYPIPRAIFPSKPKGASTVLTQYYFPDYYYPFEIEMAFPLPVELVANFDIFGVLLMLPLGGIVGVFYLKMSSLNPIVSVISVFFVVRSSFVFRNDLFNNLIAIQNLILSLLVAVVAMKLVSVFLATSSSIKNIRN